MIPIKKMMALLLTVAFLALPHVIYAEAEGDTFQRANALLSALLGETFQKEGATVTRGEFITAVTRLFKIENAGGSQASFTDVSGELALPVNTALAVGWLSDGEQFFPNEPIKYNEAVKIAVCAAGYRFVAENKGGYPFGYLTVAAELGLTGNETQGLTLSDREAMLLLFRLLNTRVFEMRSLGTEEYYERADETYLNRLYNIYPIRGIVSATPYNSLDYDVPACAEGTICIDGTTFAYDYADAGMLGWNCYAYYREENTGLKSLVCLVPYKNDEIVLQLKDIADVGDTSLDYDDAETGREKRLALDSGWMLVYNGRPSPVNVESFTGNGTVRFLDNDGDGSYDFIFVERSRYIVVDAVDVQKKTVADKNSPDGLLDLGIRDCIYSISDTDGEFLTLYDVTKGDVLAVKESTDGLLVRVTVCRQTVSGMVTEVNGDELTVGENNYWISSYFQIYYGKELAAGTTGTFTVGTDGTLITFEPNDGSFDYAYLIAAEKQGLGKAKMKIYPAGGPVVVCPVADKLVLDGKLLLDETKNEWLAAVEAGKVTPQLVRVARNQAGEINRLDLAGDGNLTENAQRLPNNDKLMKYQFSTTSFLYRNTPKACSPYFNVGGSIIFKIPKDLSDESGFFTLDASALNDGASYQFEVYDLDEYGGAAVLVLVEDNHNPDFGVNDASYIVEKLTLGSGPDGEIGRRVSCWSDGRYYQYFLSDSVRIAKDNKKDLLPGDIVRLRVNSQNSITAICVDFEGETLQPNKLSNAAFSSGSTFSYQVGGLFRGSGNYVYLSDVRDNAGDIDYSFGNLRNFHINTEYIVRYDSAKQTLRPISADELKSYCAYGQDNSYLVIRTGLYAAKCVFVYE